MRFDLMGSISSKLYYYTLSVRSLCLCGKRWGTISPQRDREHRGRTEFKLGQFIDDE